MLAQESSFRLIDVSIKPGAIHPATIGEQITAKSGRSHATRCAKLRADTSRLLDPAQAAKLTLRSLAKRIHALDTEIAALDNQLEQLVAATAPR